MNLEDKAREYAEGKSSASVFRDTHIRDFKAGYREGLKDGELLRLLKDSTDALKWYLDNSTSELTEPFFNIGMNQITAIGFIYTAKSITRFKEIEESKGFAEYYLIGTLFSILYVVVAYLIIIAV